MDPVSLSILPALSIHTSDFRHGQRETRERKEFHLQSAFQVPRVIQGVIRKATLFQLHKHPNDTGKGSQLQHSIKGLWLGEG